VISTWFVLGVRTGVWDAAYFWCIPLLLLHFISFYSFSVLLAVLSHSTVVCIFGSVFFWLLGWGVNYHRILEVGSQSTAPFSFVRLVVETAYWIFPKPIDGGLILFDALDAAQHFEKPTIFQMLESSQVFSPVLSSLVSLVVAGVVLVWAAYQF